MKYLTSLSCLLFALLFIAPAQVTQAQAPAGGQRMPIIVRKVDGGKVSTPQYAVKGASSPAKTKDWFKVAIEYDSEPDWIDELNFTVYVLVRGRTRDAPPETMFKGETSYIHIAAGRRHLADMYLNPTIISRFGDPIGIAVEARIGGRLVAQTGKPEPTAPWWNNYTPVEGVLLDRSQTPFVFVDIDDQEIIKRK
jgi:hypothetical protein